MSNPQTLSDVFEEAIKDLYNAENQLLKALPKLAKKASNQALSEAFLAHAQETKVQIGRLDQIGKSLEIALTGKTCKAMQGLIEEGSEVLDMDSENPALIDVMLIMAAQKCEHYEISSYGSLRALADELGYEDEADLLSQTLDEEAATDELLTQITEEELMPATGSEGNEDEDEDSDEQESDEDEPTKKIVV